VSIAVGTLFLYLSFRKDRLGIPCQKAGDRSGMNPEQPCGIGGCPFPPPDHLHNLGLLLSGRLRFPAANASLASSRCNAGLCAFSQHCPFKLGKRPNHLHHHATGWRCRIDRFGQAGLPGPGHRENFTYIAAFVWRPAVISWWKIFGRTVKRRPCACAKKGDKRRTIGLHYAAAQAVQEYIQRAGIASGPLFRPRLHSHTEDLRTAPMNRTVRTIQTKNYRMS
jgi:hypothetical protein